MTNIALKCWNEQLILLIEYWSKYLVHFECTLLFELLLMFICNSHWSYQNSQEHHIVDNDIDQQECTVGSQINIWLLLLVLFGIDEITWASPSIWHQPIVLKCQEPQHHQWVRQQYVGSHYKVHTILCLQEVHQCAQNQNYNGTTGTKVKLFGYVLWPIKKYGRGLSIFAVTLVLRS